MESWTHFLVDHDTVNADQSSNSGHCFRPSAVSSLQVSTSSIFVERSIDSVLLRTLSSSPLQGMSQNLSDSSVGCIPVDQNLEGSFRASETNQIPRRNLTEAFEELYIKPSFDTDTPVIKKIAGKDSGLHITNMISPTGVAELHSAPLAVSPCEYASQLSNVVTPSREDVNAAMPDFNLHPDLKKELSNALVNRVSFYSIIHDINKEATAMASNDDSGYNRNPDEQREEYDPLIVAVNGYPEEPLSSTSSIKVALIDEEMWLLNAIDARGGNESRSVNACPPTFLQAIGERDYENPLASLSNGSRTQLWKPSRSWWEAKSGKNPWIEPKSHNKRWRYLWPLIHYHKFLARCIKKLKRNGVDVKTSVSPVSVFLREEVCAVSDHLAGVSLFDSDKWMNCLQNFNGWTDPDEEAEERIRDMVSTLKLRPLTEPGDVDSPLLRSQIDEHYLRAMLSARDQMAGAGLDQERRSSKDPSARQKTPDAKTRRNNSQGFHPQTMDGHPPAYPRTNVSPAYKVPHHANDASPAAMRKPRWGYPPPGQWWGNGWNPHAPYPYTDDVSVQSALSGDSFPQHFDMNAYHGGMPHPHYYHPMMYHPHQQLAPGHPQGPYDQTMPDPSMYPHDAYHADPMTATGWMGHIPHQASNPASLPGTPGAPIPAQDMPQFADAQTEAHVHSSELAGGDHTPYKYNPNHVPMSPYWGHLDHASLAMMGIATPQGPSAPQTPARGGDLAAEQQNELKTDSALASLNVQPLLLRQQYYGYGYGNREGYGPPSPATQFMMSPQANFAYNYGYGVSPSRPTHNTRANKSPTEKKDARNDDSEGGSTPPASVTPIRSTSNKRRESPATVTTAAESESLS